MNVVGDLSLTDRRDRWISCEQAGDWSDVLVEAMRLGGVEKLFFVSGSELNFYQEAIAKAQATGRPAPDLVTMTHEGVALNAAIGHTMIRRLPAATAVHVDAGTLHQGAAIHTAWRGEYPVLMTAGTGPRAAIGSMAGGRDRIVQALQEPRDQNGIVRQYTKLDHRLEQQDHPGYIVSRLLQVATSRPAGPAYLSIPREVAMLSAAGLGAFPTREGLGVARKAGPDPADVQEIARCLAAAERPIICLERSGGDPDSVAAVVALAEALAIGVCDSSGCRMNFPTSHWAYESGGAVADADVVLVLDAVSPYVPGAGDPAPVARIAWVAPDPVLSRYKTIGHRADWWIPADSALTALALLDAAQSACTAADRRRIEARRRALSRRREELAMQAEATAAADEARGVLTGRLLARALGRALDPSAIILNDALSNGAHVRTHAGRDLPGTYFRSGSSSGGWGAGAAFGAKLAAPDRDVVHATGDGYFMFGSPLSALWSAAHHKAAYLTVVFVNGSYSTGTESLRRTYPNGAAASAGNYEGGTFLPPPNFAKLAEAANCYGAEVHEISELDDALRRGLDVVHNGTPAVIAAHVLGPVG